jgi:hypothetical protein
MNARFRIGKYYKFKLLSDKYFIINDRPLKYIGYSPDCKRFHFIATREINGKTVSVPQTIHVRTLESKKYVEVDTEWTKWRKNDKAS